MTLRRRKKKKRRLNKGWNPCPIIIPLTKNLLRMRMENNHHHRETY